MGVALAGIIIIGLLWGAQEWYLEQHRRRFSLWRPARERHFWADPDERADMWIALTTHVDDADVERARRACIAILVGCAVAGVLVFGAQASGS